jgi:hypothetical protein
MDERISMYALANAATLNTWRTFERSTWFHFWSFFAERSIQMMGPLMMAVSSSIMIHAFMLHRHP